jgi:hypothetical protein
MATRRVVEHKGYSIDREKLVILTCFEEGISKEEIKQLSPYSKKHQVLVFNGLHYEYLRKNA